MAQPEPTTNSIRFDAEAAAWDSNPDVHKASAGALTALLERVPCLKSEGKAGAAHSSSHKGPRVLEIGCGTGLLSFLLAPHVSSLLAVDASTGMINALTQKLSQPSAPDNITPLGIMLEDPDDPRLPPANTTAPEGPRMRFDLIVSHLTLHHIPDMQPLLATMMGCLAPGGIVALTDFEDFGPLARRFHPEAKMSGVERHGIPAREMEQMMRDVGFKDVKVEVGWTMRKEIEAWPGEWGQKRPTVEERSGKPLEEMDFPFLVCMGGR